MSHIFYLPISFKMTEKNYSEFLSANVLNENKTRIVQDLNELREETLNSWKDPIRKEIRGWKVHERRWNPEKREWYEYDENGFVKWNFPFADLINPYRNIKTYSIKDVPRSSIIPGLSYKSLDRKIDSWPLKNLKVNESYKRDFINKNTLWWSLNNPCDVSCGKNSIHAIWLSDSNWGKAWDWQILAKYQEPLHWLASHMKMIRELKLGNDYLYRNRSIQGIICNWMQWFYDPKEDKSLKAMRLCRISHAVKKINENCSGVKINRDDRINTEDKETLMAFTQLTAEAETGCKFSRKTLEKAYDLAFHKK